jgi:phosphate acetyltransferase
MNYIEELYNKASKLNKIIVLPETEDPRILKAAEIIHTSKIAQVILVGNEADIRKTAQSAPANLEGIKIIDPIKFEQIDQMVELYVTRRKGKNLTAEEARKTLTTDYPFFGGYLVAMGLADGMVSGASHATAHTIKATVHSVGTAKGHSIISSFFIMVHPNPAFGYNGVMFYADCGVIPNPTAAELSEIAITTADSFKKLVGQLPKVAMLSFSTKGSGKHPDVDKVNMALGMAKKNAPELLIDGEMQADAALIPEIGKKKAPESKVAGAANVLIFPDLDAGNIAYKLTERLGGATALGPIFQGVAKPINDLSRGCSATDVVQITAITAIQAQ